jgi:hypothetical protein
MIGSPGVGMAFLFPEKRGEREIMDKKVKSTVKERQKEFLKEWDGKCLICGKPVEQAELMSDGMPDSINGAVIGDYIDVYGHRTCIQNVDRVVVVPNRMRVRQQDGGE